MKKDTKLVLAFLALMTFLLMAGIGTEPQLTTVFQSIGKWPITMFMVLAVGWLLKSSYGRGAWVTIIFGLMPCLLITMEKTAWAHAQGII